MQVARSFQLLAAATIVYAIPACTGPTKQEQIAEEFRQDSLAYLRSELADQAMQASMFVNEVNKTLAKARSLSKPTQLESPAELADVNAERNAVLARVTQLVEQLDASRSRIAGLRKEISVKDTALANQLAQFEATLMETNMAAETQRAELQAVIDRQKSSIATLTSQVDTLHGTVSRLTSEQNSVYVVTGTKAELIKKGILVREGPRRFVVVGDRPLVPARQLDPSVFTKLDRTTDTTIVLPDGVYKMASRQNGSFAVPQEFKHGGIVGGLTIEDPERFWEASRYLILVRG